MAARRFPPPWSDLNPLDAVHGGLYQALHGDQLRSVRHKKDLLSPTPASAAGAAANAQRSISTGRIHSARGCSNWEFSSVGGQPVGAAFMAARRFPPPWSDLNPLDAVHGGLYQALHVQRGLGGLQLPQHGAQPGMAGSEDGAAVISWMN